MRHVGIALDWSHAGHVGCATGLLVIFMSGATAAADLQWLQFIIIVNAWLVRDGDSGDGVGCGYYWSLVSDFS